ncbi:MAG: protein translocase subunit SecF [Hyphomonadaceae bacterium]|nr:protein translocase subunit SecF [Hyphomonadaceae bacterium]
MRDISLVKLLPVEPRVPFISLRMAAAVLSTLALIASAFLFATRNLNYGIDFTGGTILEVDTGNQPPLEDIRTRLGQEIGGIGLQTIAPRPGANSDHDYVRIAIPLQEEGEEGAAVQQRALANIQNALGDVIPDLSADACGPDTPAPCVRGQDVVGSKVSGELRRKGLLAIGIALLMVLVYIWFRFEWQFAAGAVIALFHDVFLTIGVFSLTRIEFNLSIIAAILTIVGYSLNDTVIVYDRIRENMRKYKKMAMLELINLSINDTLSRTILTSMTTLMALIALYVLGGPGLRGFSFAMIWGVMVGTYSSIFVASPLLLLLGVRRGSQTETPVAKSETA